MRIRILRYCDAFPRILSFSRSFGSMLKPPDQVKGIKILNDETKDLFSAEFKIPCIHLPGTYLTKIFNNSRMSQFILKGFSKKVIPPSDDLKSVLLNPNLINDVNRNEILNELKRITDDGTFSEVCIKFTYNDWNFKQCIKAVLPDGLELSGYSQIGHIIHLNLRENLLPYKTVIGQLLLDKNHNCKTVINKLDVIENEYRCFVPDLLAGEARFETIVSENKFRYKLDFSQVFWNPRLVTEHARLVSKFNKKSIVYDCCSGIGPFVIPALAKKVTKVLANDLNPLSIKYLSENVKLNHLTSGPIAFYNMDAAEFITKIIKEDLKNIFRDSVNSKIEENLVTSEDTTNAHVIINLPGISLSFLKYFWGLFFESGLSPGELSVPIFVHCYLFVKADDDVDDDWYREKASQLVVEEIGPLESLDLHLVRKVAGRKIMYYASFMLPENVLFSEKVNEIISGNDKLLDDRNHEQTKFVSRKDSAEDEETEIEKPAEKRPRLNSS